MNDGAEHLAALFYTGLESGLASFRQKKDVYNEITAAALTGIIYKSSRMLLFKGIMYH